MEYLALAGVSFDPGTTKRLAWFARPLVDLTNLSSTKLRRFVPRQRGVVRGVLILAHRQGVLVYGSKGESFVPLPQRNFGYFTYVSDDGTSYNLKVDAAWAAVGAHGLAARANGQPRFIASGLQRPRRVRYVDLTTGRSVQGAIGTAAAYAAIAIGATHDFPVPGQVAAVTYTVAAKIGEKVPGSVIQTSLGDHA